MANNNNKPYKFWNDKVTLSQQAIMLKRLYPGCSINTFPRLCFKYELQPRHICRKYLIQITYALGKSPRIIILTPKLQIPKGKKLPHTYKNGELCLYYPKVKQWKPSDFISNTIVPWTSLWLFYYELWLATGEWLGEGTHHEQDEFNE